MINESTIEYLPIIQNPSREDVLIDSIKHHKKIIASEWDKSEPNLLIINFHEVSLKRNTVELTQLQTKKN